MRSIIRSSLNRFGIALRKYERPKFDDFASLKTDKPLRGTVLLAYIVEPFMLSENEKVSTQHTHHIESVIIAESFLELGFDVDVIDYRNANFQPSRDYQIFVSARTNFSRIAAKLNKSCIKIAHLDTAHYLFNNASAYSRLLQLQHRQNATASSLKVIEKNRAPEDADYLAILGNQFTLDTYRYAGKRMFALPVPTPVSYEEPIDKDFESARTQFLWLGSRGLAHKGLDLVLEAFSRMPDLNLVVCGPVDASSESEFRQIYYKELYETENIETVGWIDVAGTEFLDITNRCIGLVYPSCSEGQAGAVVTCMRAGLIPVVSYESGVDVDDFGILLEECSVDQVASSVSDLASASTATLSSMAINTWRYADKHHARDYYSLQYREMIETILSEQGAAAGST